MKHKFKIWRGDVRGGEFSTYSVKLEQGMVVLDAIHRIQAEQAPELGVRWNCKAGKCGSCSMEINGHPKLACMTRMNELPIDKVVIIQPLKTFPLIKDLVTDVSWNYQQNKKIAPFNPGNKQKNKDNIIGYLSSHNVDTRPIFSGNITRQPYFKTKNYKISGNLENSDRIMMQTFWIGVYPGLTIEMMEYVVNTIEDFINYKIN